MLHKHLHRPSHHSIRLPLPCQDVHQRRLTSPARSENTTEPPGRQSPTNVIQNGPSITGTIIRRPSLTSMTPPAHSRLQASNNALLIPSDGVRDTRPFQAHPAALTTTKESIIVLHQRPLPSFPLPDVSCSESENHERKKRSDDRETGNNAATEAVPRFRSRHESLGLIHDVLPHAFAKGAIRHRESLCTE